MTKNRNNRKSLKKFSIKLNLVSHVYKLVFFKRIIPRYRFDNEQVKVINNKKNNLMLMYI